MINLEEKLKQNQDLFAVYSRIKGKAADIWEEPLLHDFTEHGPRHSRQIITILDRILSYWEEFDLNDAEILVLLASAWLHDVGMQNMKDAEGKADILREAHAEYSYKIILKNGMVDEDIFLKKLDCGFRDNQGEIQDYDLLSCTALVCKGHSGKYFQGVVDRFGEATYSVLGQEVDGAFLTALLMVADELDLEGRGNMDPKIHYSSMSRLHQKKHQRISRVDYDFDSTSHQIKLSVRFQFWEEETEDFRKRLKQWVSNKLAGQFSRTMQIFQKKMGYCLCPKILEISDLSVLPEAQHPSRFSAEETSLLERETSEMDLYDRKTEKKRLQKLLGPDRPGGIFYYYNVDPYDRDFFFGWFEKAARAHPKVSFQDILIKPESAFTFTLEFLTEKTTAFCRDAGSSLKPVLLIEDFGLFQPQLQSDYLKMLSQSAVFQSSKAVVVLLSSVEKMDLVKIPPHVAPIKMPPFTREIIREVLESQKIPSGHDLENLSQMLYDKTSGSPEKVYEIVELLKQ